MSIKMTFKNKIIAFIKVLSNFRFFAFAEKIKPKYGTSNLLSDFYRAPKWCPVQCTGKTFLENLCGVSKFENCADAYNCCNAISVFRLPELLTVLTCQKNPRNTSNIRKFDTKSIIALKKDMKL
jgi:hypothetical protein